MREDTSLFQTYVFYNEHLNIFAYIYWGNGEKRRRKFNKNNRENVNMSDTVRQCICKGIKHETPEENKQSQKHREGIAGEMHRDRKRIDKVLRGIEVSASLFNGESSPPRM